MRRTHIGIEALYSAAEEEPVSTNSRIPGLRDFTPEERRAIVIREAELEEGALDAFDSTAGLSLGTADHMIENVLGTFAIPMGVATNLTVDGRDYLVPMATEEPSVVAAASNAALMARGLGGFTTSTNGNVMLAQIQLLDVVDPEAARLRLLEAEAEIVDLANAQDPVLVRLGGGALGIEARIIPARTETLVVVHLLVEVLDAMGANAVNSMAEAVAPRLAELARGRSLLRILSNKADRRITRVRAVFDREMLGGDLIVDNIIRASDFAAADPYRAATHNKGIMNGVSAVVLATGNDTRAVEAGCHSHAARFGSYSALSRFERDEDDNLVGSMELPLAVGLVGGATRAHPSAQAAVRMLGVSSARELAAIIAAVGLAQNLAACRALADEGIQRGHMTLHARTVAASVGATSEEIPLVAAKIIEERRIHTEYAEKVLADLRKTL